MNRSKYLEIVKVVTLCCAWYASSSSNNIIGKTLLTDFPYPLTLTMVQLLSVSVYSSPLLRFWGVKRVTLEKSVYLKLIIPLSFGKFLSSAMSHLSILKVSLSYAHTVKATMPFFTVILSRILLGEKHTNAVYISIIPIIGGVALSTVTELSFDVIGLISALAATFLFTIQNIYSKQCMKNTGMHHFHILMMLARIATVCFVPVWFILDFRAMFHDNDSLQNTSTIKLITLLFFDGFFNFLQHVFAFTILALVSPLTYSVANSTKRIVVITASLIMLRNPVTLFNICGMVIAILGVLYYNKVKYDENEAAKRATLLPHSHSDKNLLLTSLTGDWPQKNGYSHQLLNGYAKPDPYAQNIEMQQTNYAQTQLDNELSYDIAHFLSHGNTYDTAHRLNHTNTSQRVNHSSDSPTSVNHHDTTQMNQQNNDMKQRVPFYV